MKKELPRKKRYLENTQHVNSVLDVVVVVARRALSPAVVLATRVSSPPAEENGDSGGGVLAERVVRVLFAKRLDYLNPAAIRSTRR